jgi:hypothetical protein
MTEKTLRLTLTLHQAQAVVEACDLYARLCIGQVEEIHYLVKCGIIKTADGANASQQAIRMVEDGILSVQRSLGYERGANMGIHNPAVCIGGKRAWEIKKVAEKALAEHGSLNPSFSGVNYDGLISRVTDDTAPQAVIAERGQP